jgi:L-fuconolactonase
MALDSFGPTRMMWGSDFPLVCAREGYQIALERSREQFADLNLGSVKLLFGDAAARIFEVR